MAMDPDRQFSSPYLSVGNNPILILDNEGSWAWLFFLEFEAKIGYGPQLGAGYFYRKGSAYDNYGRIDFKLEGSFAIASSNKARESDFSLLGDVGVDAGFHADWSKNKFMDVIDQFSFDISATVIDVTWLGESFPPKGLGLSGGFSAGIALSSRG
jgi:hypothetical protein